MPSIECLSYGKALPCTRSTADGRGTRDLPRNDPQGAAARGSAAPLLKTDADGRTDGGVFVSDEDSRERSPELGRRRSGSGTEADAAGAEDPRRRGGSQGHRPVRGATRVRQLVVAVAGRESCGVGGQATKR